MGFFYLDESIHPAGGSVQELRGCFGVFEPLSNDAQRQRLHARDRLVAGRAIAHHAGEVGHFGNPAAVVLTFEIVIPSPVAPDVAASTAVTHPTSLFRVLLVPPTI